MACDGNVCFTDAQIANLPDGSLLKKYASLIASIAARTSPYPSSTNGYDTFLGECQAWLPSRTLPYFKQTPGDCGSSSSGVQTSTAAKVLSLGPQGASTALSIGKLVDPANVLTGASGFAASTAASILGAATVVAGPIIGIIEAILQHHAVAVANEQATLCSVSIAFNQTISQIDNAVLAGYATAQQGVTGVQSLVNQLKAAIDQSIKDKAGNSGSNYKGVLDAHALFAAQLYVDFAPTYIAAPLSPPQPTFANPPASSVAAAAGFTSNSGVGSSPLVPAALPSPLPGPPSWGTLALIAGIVIAFLLLRGAS